MLQMRKEGLVTNRGLHPQGEERGDGGPVKEGSFKGILAEGAITEEGLLGELQGKPIGDLVRLLKSGDAYVNVQTGTIPDGEIRGQIK